MLSEKYPAEIAALFTEQINKEAESAYGRESYQRVCANIRTFAEAGYEAEARALIESFKATYKRKPAFVDELERIQEPD
jgi:hypothetical protein